jgi:hypothetical protein
MATKSSQINVTDLDFETIGDNLKNYLKGQDKLKDYDFEGSTMSLLIDLLAYSSHIGAVNTNIAGSELFLDSAQIRKNVVSRAKDLGFTPQSERCSKAKVNLTLLNVRNADGTYPTITEMTMPRGAKFSSVYDGVDYTFVVSDSKKPTQDTGKYTYTGIDLAQGTYATDQYVYDRQIKNSKFVLSNERVDKGLMTVSVTSDGVSTLFNQAIDTAEVKTTSAVFYTQENEDGYVEVYFGDGVLGKELLDGDMITVTYIIVDGVHAEATKSFTQVTAVNGYNSSTVVATIPATGGAEKESIESIKFKATKFYTSQNRLVTLNDYKAKVTEYYPNADAVAVWGGEDNDPPEYGKVFLAIKPKNSDYLTETEKLFVKNNLNKLNMLTVRPTIIDADLVKILISTVFKYNANSTDLTQGELETLVTSTISEYDSSNLTNFDAIFRHSNLVKVIDATHASILSNITNIRLRKKESIIVNNTKGYTVEFGNPLYNPNPAYNKAGGGVTTTTGFYVSGDSVNIQYFDDDGSGNIRRFYQSGSTRIYQDSAAGTVDYQTGKYTINAINITSTVNTDASIDFTIIPTSFDVVAKRGNLIDISTDAPDISVTGEIDTIASGESGAGVGFSSTSSTSY